MGGGKALRDTPLPLAHWHWLELEGGRPVAGELVQDVPLEGLLPLQWSDKVQTYCDPLKPSTNE